MEVELGFLLEKDYKYYEDNIKKIIKLYMNQSEMIDFFVL